MKKVPHLYIVPGKENLIEGPITRLQLWEYFPPVSKTRFLLFVVSKLMLLGLVLYVILGH